MSDPMNLSLSNTWCLSSTKFSSLNAKINACVWHIWEWVFCNLQRSFSSELLSKEEAIWPLVFDINTRLFHWAAYGFGLLLVLWMACIYAWIYFENLQNSSQYFLLLKPQKQKLGCFLQQIPPLLGLTPFLVGLQMESGERRYIWTPVPCATSKCPTSAGQSVAWLKSPWVC